MQFLVRFGWSTGDKIWIVQIMEDQSPDLNNWRNKQKSQVIPIGAKYRQMAFRSVLVHLPEILEE